MKEHSKTFLTYLSVTVVILLQITRATAHEGGPRDNALTPTPPRYEMKLNLNEFSLLNSAALAGLEKYGVTLEFSLKMAREHNQTFWNAAFTGEKSMEVFAYYLAEKSADLIKSVNFDQLDANSRIALQALQSLSEKMAQAQSHPVWDLIKVSGEVVEENGAWFIAGDQGKYQITGDKLEALQMNKGKRLVVNGYMKAYGQIETAKFWEKRANTLELFVMSHCPFGQRAEKSLLDFLQRHPGKNKPNLEVRYLFYKTNETGKTSFTALHGEEEVQENLVQMMIRDRYPQYFHDYLLSRIDNDCAWEQSAKKVGLTDAAIKAIAQTIANERDSLVQQEYHYVAETLGIADGSPSYVWEGERVADIRQLAAFKDLDFASSPGRCSD